MPPALVCDIQRFSVHDGPGIRTTVFFKGCPLRCRWCQNPEALRFENELIFSSERCIACGECAQACPIQAIRFDHGPHINWEKCDACFICTEACPARALEPAAREFSPAALVKELVKDREFYEPEGGVTLSGGEPLARPDFLRELLPLIKQEQLHLAVQTCGHFNWESLQPVLPQIDLVLFDLKALSEDRHRKLTGQSNRVILENLRRIIAKGIPRHLRMPVIPGLNDSEEELARVARFLLDLGETEIVLLPYHRLGESKLEKLNSELKPLGIPSMSEKELQAKSEVFIKAGLRVRKP
jgi:pyruvate formate lyase activating enzyme